MKANRADRRAMLAQRRQSASWDWVDRTRDGLKLLTERRYDFADHWGGLGLMLVNDFYVVMVFERETAWGRVQHLAIRAVDGQPDIPWKHKQRIKDELCGLERTAFEVFPALSELTDFVQRYYNGPRPVIGSGAAAPLPTITGWDHNSLAAVTLASFRGTSDQHPAEAIVRANLCNQEERAA